MQVLLKCAQITVKLHIILNLFLQNLRLSQFLPGELTFSGNVLRSVARVPPAYKAAD
jgi:hypothetical protein